VEIKQFKFFYFTAIEPDASSHNSPTTEISKLKEEDIAILKTKLKLANLKLKTQSQQLKQQATRIKKLMSRLNRLNNLQKRSRNVAALTTTQIPQGLFSEGQLQIIHGKRKHKYWTSAEMAKSIALHSLSSKACVYLRNVYKIPLPHVSTIKRWLGGLDMKPGILRPAFQILTELGKLPVSECIAVLAFDEVEIDDSYCYDQHEDKVYGGCSKMLSVCLRGLFKKWKQVVYYDFEEDIKMEKVLSVIRKAESVGISVVAIVNDMSTFNIRLWNELGVSIDKTFFENPITGQKVWVFADFPHLLKLLRNHLLDKYFTLADGTRIDKSVLERILQCSRDDLKICYKLTAKHLKVEKKERQRVRPAFQVFSSSVAKAISFLNIATSKVSNFFQLVNDFSDVMNSGFYQSSSNPFKNPLGINYPEQKNVLMAMQETIQTMTVGDLPRTRKPGLKPFQKGLIISITSVCGLYEDMRKSPINCKYILTRRLTQDYVESSFSNFRSLGG